MPNFDGKLGNQTPSTRENIKNLHKLETGSINSYDCIKIENNSLLEIVEK